MLHRSEVRSALAALGISDCAALTYLALLDRGEVRHHDLATVLHVDARVATAAYRELVELGLAETVRSVDDPCTLTPPGSGIDRLLRRQQLRLAESCAALTRAFEGHRAHGMRTGARPVVEVIDAATAGERVQAALQQARAEVRMIDTLPRCGLRDTGRPDQVVRYRIVHTSATLPEPAGPEEHPGPGAGYVEEIRVVGAAACRLLLVDDEIALMSSVEDPEAVYVIHPSEVLTVLATFFEHVWRDAVPLTAGATTSSYRLRAVDRKLLVLLAGGMGDDVAARCLGISRRTLSRRLAPLMARTGATTRFQLALQARQRGWI